MEIESQKMWKRAGKWRVRRASKELQYPEPFQSKIQRMHRQQAVGLLGGTNNPKCSAQGKHLARQKLIAAASKNGISKHRIAGLIGATTNPSSTWMQQHEARVSVLNIIAID
jgi:hypothetical protein